MILNDDDSLPVHFPIETLRGIRTTRVSMLIGCSSVRPSATQVSVHSSDPSCFALQQFKAFLPTPALDFYILRFYWSRDWFLINRGIFVWSAIVR